MKLLKRYQKYRVGRIRIGAHVVRAIIADTFIKRLLGLMYVKGLNGGACMLFVFPASGRHGIWMRNMLFPIDIVWVNSSGNVIDCVQNARPCNTLQCEVFVPSSNAKYIIEARSGFVKRHGLKNRSKIIISL